jgi:hypothetical protein
MGLEVEVDPEGGMVRGGMDGLGDLGEDRPVLWRILVGGGSPEAFAEDPTAGGHGLGDVGAARSAECCVWGWTSPWWSRGEVQEVALIHHASVR